MVDADDHGLLEKIKNNPELREFLIKADWREEPVDILTFISDPKYLGNATDNGNKIYPIWKDTLEEAYGNDKIFEIVLSGGIGTGKSSVADLGVAYSLYRVLCLKNPWDYYKLLVGKPLSIVFFSITLSLSNSTNFVSFQNKIQSSPWFIERGELRGNVNPILYFDGIDYKLCSPRASGGGVVGGDIVAGVMDELNTPNESLGVKERAFNAYQSVVRRIESRFMEKGALPGLKLFLCASKDDELSFIDAHVNKRKNSKNVLIKDVSLWEAKTRSYSGVTFPIAVGDAFRVSKIIMREEIADYTKEGYRIVNAPVEHSDAFNYDLIGALRDIAGITVQGIRKYKLFPSEKFIKDCIDTEKRDPVDIGTIKTGLEDETPWIAHVDLTKVRTTLREPHYMHLDISFSGDAMSIACSSVKHWIESEKQSEEGTYETVKLPVIETDFIVRIKSTEGDRIPLHKMRKLIIELRRAGLNIAKFTADLKLASEDTLQILNKANIPAEYLSVDKTIKPYMDWRNLVFEHRWVCHHHSWLYFEAKHIEHNRETNKIDHPDKVEEVEILEDGNVRTMVGEGSKDCLDAVVGSVYQAMMNARTPVNVTAAGRLINSLNKEDKKIDLPSDWFVSDKSRKKGKDGKPVKILNEPKERHLAMIDVIKDLEIAGNKSDDVGKYLGGGR